MGISTRFTNRIRHVLDSRIPRRLRDSRWFMAPMFFVWCKGKKIREWMDFKELAPRMSVAELRDLYRSVDSLAAGRPTDTNPEALAFVLASIDPGARTLADIGSGRGYFLGKVQEERKLDGIALYGCDLLEQSPRGRARQVVADHELLPFRDDAFDVVTCMHTLEHARDLEAAIAELRRIAGKQLLLIVPCQKRFHYTMDMHLQFFETPADFAIALGVPESEIRRFGDDLVYVSEKARGQAQ